MIKTTVQSGQQRFARFQHLFGASTGVLGLGLFVSSYGYAQPGGHGSAGGPSLSASGHSVAGRTTPGLRHAAPAAMDFRGNGAVHVNAVGSTTNPSAPRPTWEMPRNVTPQWEIPSFNNIQPNDVQGNRVAHGHGFGVGYAAAPYFIDPYAFNNDMFLDQGYADQQPAGPVNAGAPQYDPRLGGPEYPPQGAPPRAPYVAQQQELATQPSNPGPVTDGLDHPEVTLIFKDGRAPMKVHSYAVTGNAVYLAENGHQQQIPLSALDLDATIEQNRASGVDFAVPGRDMR